MVSYFCKVSLKDKHPLIVADARLPQAILKNLERHGKLLPFSSTGITYGAISGHPDVFLCQVNNQWIAAPNLPVESLKKLEQNGIPLIFGSLPVGEKFPESVRYNAVINSSSIIHRTKYTDKVVLKHTKELKTIDVKQAYTRCSLLVIKENHFLTSDQNIFKTLSGHGWKGLYIDPAPIQLPGLQHGLIGGCCGVWNQTLFVTGHLDSLPEGTAIRQLIKAVGYQLVELHKGPLIDGGSILFL